MSKADVEFRGLCKGWRPGLILEGVWAPSLSSGAFLFFLSDPVHGLPHWDVVQVKGTGGRGTALKPAWSQGLDTL